MDNVRVAGIPYSLPNPNYEIYFCRLKMVLTLIFLYGFIYLAVKLYFE